MKASKKILGLILISTSLMAIGCSNDKTLDTQEEIIVNTEVEKNELTSTGDENAEDAPTNPELDEEHSKIEGDYVCTEVYSYDSESDSLIANHSDLAEKTPENVLKALGEKGIIDKNTKVLEYKESEENGEKIGILNLSEEFQDFNLGSSGSLGRLDAVAQTFLENLGIDKLKILLEGQNYEDGHTVLEDDYFFTLENTKERSIG